jgi:NTP pyrophosphatase (non-canonical NTP hydrolase)
MQLNKHDRLLNACRSALKVWGDKQVDIAIEECGELIVALAHSRRSKAKDSEVAGEAADCLIMSLQMLLRYTPSETAADEVLTHKMQRLEERLALASKGSPTGEEVKS